MVQALPSLQAVPFGAGEFVQVPVAGSTHPGMWQASVGGHAIPVWHTPPTQIGAEVQLLARAPQGVPSGAGVPFEHRPVVTSQVPAE